MGHLISLPDDRKNAVLGALEAAGCTAEEFLSIERDPEITKRVYAATLPLGMSTEAQVSRAIRWYRLYAGIQLTTEAVMAVLPERESQFDRLSLMAPGMTPNKCYDALVRQFGAESMWRSIDDLDSAIVSVRKTDALYAVWFRDRREADEDNSNRPASSFKQEECQTLEERLVHDGLYFQEHQRHLDEVKVTLCAGSRDCRSGDVPSVRFVPAYRQVGVNTNWCGVRDHDPNLRVRSARKGKKVS